jgi:hypothetical protein
MSCRLKEGHRVRSQADPNGSRAMVANGRWRGRCGDGSTRVPHVVCLLSALATLGTGCKPHHSPVTAVPRLPTLALLVGKAGNRWPPASARLALYDGGRIGQVLNAPSHLCAVSWSPSGNHLALSEPGSLWIVDRTTAGLGTAEMLPALPCLQYWPARTRSTIQLQPRWRGPDVVSVPWQRIIWLYDCRKKAWSRLRHDVSANRAIVDMQWSPDGRHLAIVCTTPGVPDSARVVLSSADGDGARDLLAPQTVSSQRPQWSVDGKRLVFECLVDVQKGRYAITTYDTDTDTLWRGPDGNVPVWVGGMIVFGTTADQVPMLRTMSPRSGQSALVTTLHRRYTHPAASPDERSIAFESPAGGKIHACLLDTASGQLTEIDGPRGEETMRPCWQPSTAEGTASQ